MWFLVYCYEDQGRIDDAIVLCGQLHDLLRNFGGETLGQQHKLWKYVEEKTEQLKCLKIQRGQSAGAVYEALAAEPSSASLVPPKKVIPDLTY